MSTQKMNRFTRLRGECRGVKQIKPVLDVATRWNSTYHMIDKALELRTPLTMLISTDNDLQPYLLSDDEWTYLGRMRTLLEEFDEATKFISGQDYPTINIVIPAYNFLMDALDQFIEDQGNDDSPLKTAAEVCFNKLQQYYVKTDDSPISMVAFSLDPGLNIDYTDRNNWEMEFIQSCKQQLDNHYRMYSQQYGQRQNEVDELPTVNLEKIPRVLQHAYGRRITARRTEERVDEIDLYHRRSMELSTVSRDVLGWWRINQDLFPVLSLMARDYLAVPGTSVPVERVFSSAKHTIPPLRRSLKPDTIRYCMMEKYRLKRTLDSLCDDENSFT